MSYTLYKSLGIPASTTSVPFIDININIDTLNFIDPMRIMIHNKDPFIADMHTYITDYFDWLIQAIHSWSKWKAMYYLSNLEETNTASWLIHLWYSKNKWGKSIWPTKAEKLYEALCNSEAVKTGKLKDIEDIALMIEDIDKDNISDIIANVTWELLLKYTQRAYMEMGWTKFVHRVMKYWDNEKMLWTKKMVSLPDIYSVWVLFVPKIIAGKSLLLNYRRAYQLGVLSNEQKIHYNAKTALCRLLQDGTKVAPYKKSLMPLISSKKSDVWSYLLNNILVLDRLKSDIIHRK